MPATKSPTTRNLTFAVPIKLTPAIDAKIIEAAKETGLKKSDIMRMSLERGIDVLLTQLNSTPSNAA